MKKEKIVAVQDSDGMHIVLSNMGCAAYNTGRHRMPKKADFIRYADESAWDEFNGALDALYVCAVEAVRAAAEMQRDNNEARATLEAAKMEAALRRFANLLGVRVKGTRTYKNVLFVSTNMLKVFTPWVCAAPGKFRSRDTFAGKFLPALWHVMEGMPWSVAADIAATNKGADIAATNKGADKDAKRTPTKAELMEQVCSMRAESALQLAKERRLKERCAALEAENAALKEQLNVLREYVQKNNTLKREEVMNLL